MEYFSTIPIITYVALVCLIILIGFIIRIEIKIKRLTRGKNMSIEDAIYSIEKDLKDFGIFRNDLQKYLNTVEKRIKNSIQGVHALNYKAFEGLDSGGGQSFAIAFLNEKGDGVIISTLHARDRVNVFSKPIINFKAIVKLSDEETLALTKATESCKL